MWNWSVYGKVVIWQVFFPCGYPIVPPSLLKTVSLHCCSAVASSGVCQNPRIPASVPRFCSTGLDKYTSSDRAHSLLLDIWRGKPAHFLVVQTILISFHSPVSIRINLTSLTKKTGDVDCNYTGSMDQFSPPCHWSSSLSTKIGHLFCLSGKC